MKFVLCKLQNDRAYKGVIS